MQDFQKALEESQKLPELSDNQSPIPDLLKGGDIESLIRAIAPGTEGKVPGAIEYSYTYKCARLQIGKVMSGFENGAPIFDDIDESERLKEIMDMSLAGEAVISKKTETFLKDGTVVIWIEWLEPKSPLPKKDRGYLTMDEILKPEHSADDDDEDVAP